MTLADDPLLGHRGPSDGRVVAIHQPDFFPWLGVFNKALQSDVLVLLDHVTNNPKSGTWTKRVRVLVNGNPSWITIPLVHPKPFRFLEIREMEIDDKDRRYEAAHKTLVQAYARAPFAEELRQTVDLFFESNDPSIAARNTRVLQWLFARLGVRPELRISSQMRCEGASTALLVNIVIRAGGTIYLHGEGAAGYQQDALFASAGIQLRRSGWPPWQYRQFNSPEWVPGLSVLDAIANCGFDGVRAMLAGAPSPGACR